MPTAPLHPAGSFCWIELAANDAAAARAFYTALFGWRVDERPIGEGRVYTIFRNAGRDVAAMFEPEDLVQRSAWMSYVAVDHADRAVSRARELGGSVLTEPTDVFDAGRMAVLRDDQGAVFGIWQANQHSGVGVRDEPNALCWNEMQARDLDAAQHFYRALFGWRMKESDEYVELYLGENAVGGLMPSSSPPEAPSYWMPYFAVDDCDRVTDEATALGATVLVSNKDIEHVGRFSVFADPGGAVFAVIKLTL